MLVFVPLFALGGMEGRLFVPLGVAYIVSIIASLVVSLTVTPVLSYWLLPNAKFMAEEKDGLLLRVLKRVAGVVIRFSVRHPWPILIAVLVAVGISGLAVSRMGRDFLPPFDEGTVQVNVMVQPGTSLEASDRIGRMADEQLMKVPGVVTVARRTGRAELDEHAMGVNVSEIIVTIDHESGRTREQILDDIRHQLADVPGAVVSAEQPLQHLISHMLSGVQAQVAIKLYGDDLATLRRTANAMKNDIADVPGVTDLQVEQQVEIPQLQIQTRRDELARNGLAVDDVNEFIETAMNGRKVSEVLRGQRNFDLVLRLDEEFREDIEYLKRLRINLPSGGGLPLSAVADVVQASGPNTINRENVRRRIVVSCNTTGRDLASIVGDIQKRLAPIQASLPTGYFIEYSGQFESQQSATRMIGLLSLASLACMFLALYTLFRSVNLALQVLAALPMAAIGAVTALVVTGQSLTVASMVGFISLAGIAMAFC